MNKVLVLIASLFLFFSCSLPRHVPQPPTIEQGKIKTINISEPVRLLNTVSVGGDIDVSVESFKLSVNLKEYTESVIIALKSEFDRKDYPYSDTAKKRIGIAVVDVSLSSSMGGNVCNIDLIVQPGNHPVTGIQASAQSISYQKAIDLAVADAVVRMLNHIEISRYLEDG